MFLISASSSNLFSSVLLLEWHALVKAGVDLWASECVVMKSALKKSTGGQLIYARKTKKGQTPGETRKKEHVRDGDVNVRKMTATVQTPSLPTTQKQNQRHPWPSQNHTALNGYTT